MTIKAIEIRNFVAQKKGLEKFGVIAFTHAGIGLENLGQFHVETEGIPELMNRLKSELNLKEIMYLSTCNRVELIFTSSHPITERLVENLIQTIHPNWSKDKVNFIASKTRHWTGINAVNHLIEVASSLDSMVLGEREIITQVRNAYNFAKENKLSGDTIRIVIRQTIETAKKVYTETSISEKSVSVVSLGFQSLMELNPKKDAKILIIGSGVTNQNMAKFLRKHGFSNFTTFNRTLENAKNFSVEFGGEAFSLSQLSRYRENFDIIITCTGANQAIITPAIYAQLNPKSEKKIIVDLAIPNDLDTSLLNDYPIDYISVESIKRISDKNLLLRKQELLKARQIIYESIEEFKKIYYMRQVELKMRVIPEHVKKIRSKAEQEVFSKELENLDEDAKEVLDKILNYMEKKYVSVPMIMAKEMLTKNQ
ncbi:glutamyl-tRNA reductase [Crocinitomix algicola]|uniref:glutamyl-tRNA reductase n=1 Tax=Crocinitomix algicola TaxID=1740263 RepID=UPI0009F5433E|nr:glutamyl-tRNA reductase [Crocinitomix algicola]